MSGYSQFPEVDRRSRLSLEQFKCEYRSRGRPVVITDAIEDWKARSRWTFDYFKSRYGGSEVTVYGYEDGEYQPDRFKIVLLADYIDKITSIHWEAYPYYIRDNWKFFTEHKDLLADYRIPDYFFDWFQLLPPMMRLPYPRLFMGPKGAVTPLHKDIWNTHFWMAQLVGRKRWILFPPDQEEFLYDCKVQPDQPDLVRFPLFRKAKPIECTVGPGDTIFVPSGWPHQVISLDPTISITYNYMGPGCFWPSLTNSVRDLLIKKIKNKSLELAAKFNPLIADRQRNQPS
jgi:hypothetical protein